MSRPSPIPVDLGREIPHRETRCAECGMKIKAADDDSEPLCWGCDVRDEILAEVIAKSPKKRTARIVEHRVPVEFARHAVRPFGLGFGELGSSKVTQALAEDRRGNPPVLAAAIVGSAICTLLGLLVLAVAAVR